ncbi:hypothetical protein BH20ACT9_BH20ACT9_04890 [soil metagenome]
MRPRLTGLACALLAAALLAGSYRLGYDQGSADTGGLPPGLSAVGELYQRVQQEALDVPPDAQLSRGALRGIVGALDDPYADYYPPSAYRRLNESLQGRFTGVGVVLQQAPEGFRVVSVLDDTPADRAGVRAGERLVSVNGRDVRHEPFEVVVSLVKGRVGTPVVLGLHDDGRRRRLRMRRARIDVPTIQTRSLGGDVGYVRLLHFSRGVGDDVRRAVGRLVDRGARGIVLDVRGNPGGLLGEAVAVAGVFIDSGPVVTVRERRGASRTLEASGDAVGGMPLVVLVDRGSASASEIVAGAVQDRGRGRLVGTRTFGKGTVQLIEPLGGRTGAKFTSAEYLTPAGTSIEGEGVHPDRVVRGDRAQVRAARALLGGGPVRDGR